MRPALPLAIALGLLGLAAPAAASASSQKQKPPASSTDYVAVSRALTEIDAAAQQGDVEGELRFARDAEGAPGDPVAQFLAVSSQPGEDERWGGFRDLSQQFSRSALPWVGMARVYLAWKTWDQAEKAITTALLRDPGCFLAVRVRAEMEGLRGKLELSKKDFQAVLQADPRNPEAHFGLSRLAYGRGDLEEAHSEAAAALEEARSLSGAWAILGEIAQDIGEPGAAADFFRGAIEQAPHDRAARVALAKLCTAQGDAGGAMEQWRAAVEIKEDPDALSALADAARAAGDAEVEQRAVERLSILRPSADQWRRVAEIRVSAHDAAGAERAYRRVLDSAPRDPAANLGMGQLYLTRGDILKAVECLRAAGEPGQGDLAILGKRLNLEKLAKPDLSAVEKSVQALVDRTYRSRLAESPSLSGNLRLRVTTDESGAASQVEVLEDSVHDEDVRACAYWNLRDAAYPPDQPGRYSFNFSFKR